jgi:hypothetical protein
VGLGLFDARRVGAVVGDAKVGKGVGEIFRRLVGAAVGSAFANVRFDFVSPAVLNVLTAVGNIFFLVGFCVGNIFLRVGTSVGSLFLRVGTSVGISVGSIFICVGCSVGTSVGSLFLRVGTSVGISVGSIFICVGCSVGLGRLVGMREGFPFVGTGVLDCNRVGACEGSWFLLVGFELLEGRDDGASDGVMVGALDGPGLAREGEGVFEAFMVGRLVGRFVGLTDLGTTGGRVGGIVGRRSTLSGSTLRPTSVCSTSSDSADNGSIGGSLGFSPSFVITFTSCSKALPSADNGTFGGLFSFSPSFIISSTSCWKALPSFITSALSSESS